MNPKPPEVFRRHRLGRLIAASALAATGVLAQGGLSPALADSSAPAAGPACSVSGATQTCVYDYTGAAQSWTVPVGVSAATVTAYGAAGAAGTQFGQVAGGAGGHEVATLSGLTTGQTFQVNVGGLGADGGEVPSGYTGAAGGWNGGGSGYTGGGGASDVRAAGSGGQYTLQDRLVVAGGGGGGGSWSEYGDSNASARAAGGAGGGSVGGGSVVDDYYTTSGGTQTSGGSNSGGGVAGNGPGCYDAGFGLGASCVYLQEDLGVYIMLGGGGGGGWYGGGIGDYDGYYYSGGGGSSHAGSQDGVTVTQNSTADGGTFTAPSGANGNGQVQISYTLPNYSATGFTAAAGSWTLTAGQMVSVGTVPAEVLTMQGDGNLVESTPSTGAVVWSTDTWGNSGANARFTADGTLEIVSGSGTVLWRSCVSGGANSTLSLNLDGTLQITDAGAAVRWFTSLTGEFHTLDLAPNTAVSVAADNHQLVMQNDGNLVWYNAAQHPVWATNTWGHDGQGYHFTFAPGGYLMVYSGANVLEWSASGGSGWWLELQGDGNIVVDDYTHNPLWSTGTSG